MQTRTLLALLTLSTLSCKGNGDGFFTDGDPADLPNYSGGGGGGGDDTGDSGDTGDTADTADTADSSADDTGDSTIPGGEDCGSGLNDIICNIVTTDQSGASFALWDHLGTPTVLVLGNAYDQQMQIISGYLAGVVTANDAASAVVLFLNANQQTATTADAALWAGTYGLETVLTDPNTSIRAAWTSSFTTTVLLDTDMRIVWISYGYVDDAQLDDRLEDL